VWDETETILVEQTEIDAEENLELQLWDSGELRAPLCFCYAHATGGFLLHRFMCCCYLKYPSLVLLSVPILAIGFQ
jgi:hypothetical protein